VFGEDPASSFEKAYTLEMYVQSYKGFDGTDVITQFGLEIKDKITLLFARRRFKQEITNIDSTLQDLEKVILYTFLYLNLFLKLIL
jgi:hypothetical protein